MIKKSLTNFYKTQHFLIQIHIFFKKYLIIHYKI